MALGIQSPDKEVRFTRSGQAVIFWLAGAVFGTAAVTLLATSTYRDINPMLPHPAWALAPLAGAVVSARLAWRLTRHAYLILTPLGIEIFPFYRPEAGMTLVSWQEVDAAEVNASRTRLSLHFDADKTSGIHLSLRPISADRRDLLIKALAGRGKLDSSSASTGD